MKQAIFEYDRSVCPASGRHAASGIASTAAILSGLVKLWFRRLQTRGHLAGLDAHQLDDIGIDRAQALSEAGKPFWSK